ncbi:MAG: hypothetical protein J4432_04585 [DPANN group archaeon]|nr:hypothetical protein [DPANN group archaeon]
MWDARTSDLDSTAYVELPRRGGRVLTLRKRFGEETKRPHWEKRVGTLGDRQFGVDGNETTEGYTRVLDPCLTRKANDLYATAELEVALDILDGGIKLE